MQYYGSTMSALENADALVIMTEGNEFWQPASSLLAQPLRRRVIFDGRNIYDPDIVAGYGLDYLGLVGLRLRADPPRQNAPFSSSNAINRSTLSSIDNVSVVSVTSGFSGAS